jgi:excisionase family DNA binding protein
MERQNLPFDDIMTLSEAAAYLKLAERTIHRMIQRSEIPCARVGGQWRFVRSVLDDWLISRMQVLPRNELAPFLQAADATVRLTPMIDADSVIDSVQPGSPLSVLQQLTAPLADMASVRRRNAFVRSLLAREHLSSTAIGHGVAVPHVRRPADNIDGIPPVSLGVCRAGTDYGAPDRLPVHFFFLLGTSSEVVHLRLLKRITLMFQDKSLSTELLAQSGTAGLLRTLSDHEQRKYPGGHNDK